MLNNNNYFFFVQQINFSINELKVTLEQNGITCFKSNVVTLCFSYGLVISNGCYNNNKKKNVLTKIGHIIV